MKTSWSRELIFRTSYSYDSFVDYVNWVSLHSRGGWMQRIWHSIEGEAMSSFQCNRMFPINTSIRHVWSESKLLSGGIHSSYRQNTCCFRVRACDKKKKYFNETVIHHSYFSTPNYSWYLCNKCLVFRWVERADGILV